MVSKVGAYMIAAGVLSADADIGKLLTEQDLVDLFQGE